RVRLLLSCQGKNERDTSLDQTGANIGIRKKEADGKAALFQPVRSGPVGRSPVGDFGGHQVCVHMEIQRGEDRGDAGGKAGVMLLPHATQRRNGPRKCALLFTGGGWGSPPKNPRGGGCERPFVAGGESIDSCLPHRAAGGTA